MICSVPLCGKSKMAKGLCQSHYDAKRHATRYVSKRKPKPFCSVCGLPSKAKMLCDKHYHAARYQEQKERLKEINKAWRKANPEKRRAAERARRSSNPEKYRITKRRCRAAKPNHYLAVDRAWRIANKVYVNKVSADWKRRNPDNGKAHAAKRRALQHGADGRHSATEVRELFVRQKGKCAICRHTLPTPYCKDHIKPLSRGGSDWIANIQLVCLPCNSSKRNKDPIDFMQQRGFLL